MFDLLRPDALDVVSPGEDCGLPSCGRAGDEYPRMPLADWKEDMARFVQVLAAGMSGGCDSSGWLLTICANV